MPRLLSLLIAFCSDIKGKILLKNRILFSKGRLMQTGKYGFPLGSQEVIEIDGGKKKNAGGTQARIRAKISRPILIRRYMEPRSRSSRLN